MQQQKPIGRLIWTDIKASLAESRVHGGRFSGSLKRTGRTISRMWWELGIVGVRMTLFVSPSPPSPWVHWQGWLRRTSYISLASADSQTRMYPSDLLKNLMEIHPLSKEATQNKWPVIIPLFLMACDNNTSFTPITRGCYIKYLIMYSGSGDV